jgi:hypothetical protein
MGGEILAVTGSQSPALLSSARRSVLDRATAPQSSALRNPDTRWGSHGDLRPLMGAEVVTPEEPHPSHSAYDKGVVPTRRAAQPIRWLQALGLASDAEAVNDLGPATVALDRNGLVRLHWANGTKITESAAREAVAAVNHICAGQRHPMLVDMTGTASVTRPARAVFAEPSAASTIALLGGSAVDRVIANFILGVSTVPVPTRFFTVEAEALAWLRDGRHDGGP